MKFKVILVYNKLSYDHDAHSIVIYDILNLYQDDRDDQEYSY